MKNAAASFVVGLVFAIGLGLSGMTQPQKVVGFLDLFGHWDPSLIFVMLGAIAVHFITYRIIRRRESPLLSVNWHVPTKTDITPSLLIGGALFGIGWGLGGFCPGPAVTSVASLDGRALVFVAAMIAGMYLFKLLDRRFKFRK